jgi:hypothetical protein
LKYEYVWNRDKGVYEIKQGGKTVAERNTMTEAKRFADNKNGTFVHVSSKPQKQVGFGADQPPAFFNYRAGRK